MSSVDRMIKQVIGGSMSADAAAAAIRKLPKQTKSAEFDSVQNYYDNPDGRSSPDDIGIVMSSANIAGKLSDADYATLYGALSGK